QQQFLNILPPDADGSAIATVRSEVITYFGGTTANPYVPAPMDDGLPTQQAAANLNAQFEEFVLSQYYFERMKARLQSEHSGRFTNDPFGRGGDLGEIGLGGDEIGKMAVHNANLEFEMGKLQDAYKNQYQFLGRFSPGDTLSTSQQTQATNLLNDLKSRIKEGKDLTKKLGEEVQDSYQRYDADQSAGELLFDFLRNADERGEIINSAADGDRALAILPYLEDLIQMYENLKIMDGDLKDYGDVFGDSVGGGGSGSAGDYEFQKCRERTQEYLERLDAWYNTLYREAVTINNARRAHAFDRISASEDLADVGRMFNQESNPFGAFLTLDSRANQEAAKKVEESKFFDSINGAFKGVASTVSGVVKTPAPLVEETGKQPVRSASEQFNTITGDAVADAVGIFTNTLMSDMLKRWFEGPGVNPQLAERRVAGRGIPVTQGIKVAKKLFAKLGVLKTKSVEDADVLTLLSTKIANKPPLINSGFKTAIEQQLTLREALSPEHGLIDPNAWFGYQSANFEASVENGIPYRSMVLLRHYRIIPVGWELAAEYGNKYGRSQKIGDLVEKFDEPGDWSSLYVISNILFTENTTSYSFSIPANIAEKEAEEVKIFTDNRQIEIYPQENLEVRCLAAISTYSNGIVTTKSGVICLDINQKRIVPPAVSSGRVRVLIRENPYYGLVNPDWVLKAPQLICNAEGPGEIVIRRQEVQNPDDPTGPKIVQIERASSCADEQTCVRANDDGGCLDFGYCTKEKFVWKFEGGQSCPSQYNSCQLFTNSKGDDSYYLKSTLATLGCSKESVGCREYLRVSEPLGSVNTPIIETPL
ncbi:hypothetical protein HN682_07450, partial [Candidatus Peregrinibacteria bacterium]|nr:hypothetical protein [Candidatus Peregrinibacteria bacterium]